MPRHHSSSVQRRHPGGQALQLRGGGQQAECGGAADPGGRQGDPAGVPAEEGAGRAPVHQLTPTRRSRLAPRKETGDAETGRGRRGRPTPAGC